MNLWGPTHDMQTKKNLYHGHELRIRPICVHMFACHDLTFNISWFLTDFEICSKYSKALWRFENSHLSLSFPCFSVCPMFFWHFRNFPSCYSLTSFYSVPWQKQWTDPICFLKKSNIIALVWSQRTWPLRWSRNFGRTLWVNQDGLFLWCSFSLACVFCYFDPLFVKAFVLVDLLKQEFVFLFKLPWTSSATVLQESFARVHYYCSSYKDAFLILLLSLVDFLAIIHITVKVSSLACAISSALPLEMWV